MHAFGVGSVVEKLRAAGGGYQIVHESPGLELGVYVLAAPEPDGGGGAGREHDERREPPAAHGASGHQEGSTGSGP